MGSPRLICKSAYIKDIQHFFELLEYAGDKIAAQHIVFRDGSVTEVNADEIISLSDAEQAKVAGIRIVFKDGGRDKLIPYDVYHQKTRERKEVVRYSDLTEVRDDSVAFGVNTGPHKMKDLDFFKYLSYVEGREGVVKEDGHGLFGLEGNIPIEDAKAFALEHEKSCKWSHIISMDGQDAIDAGFDRREAWKNLIVSKAPEIAEAYNISMENLVINCAYHANTDNPHAHLLFYSTDPTEGFVKGGREGMNRATEKLKSTLVNTIFKDETAMLGQEKSTRRDALRDQLRERLEALAQSPVARFAEPLEELSAKLEGAAGKQVYEYLPPELKLQTDAYVEDVIRGSDDLAAIFEAYCGAQEKMIARYVSSPEKLQAKMEQFCSGFFHPGKKDLKLYHNMVIRAALELSQSRDAWQRTTEEKNPDNTTSESLLSTESLEEDLAEQRTAEGKIADSTMPEVPLSTESLEEDLVEQRTAEEEIADSTMPEVPLSTESFEENLVEQRTAEEESTEDTTLKVSLSSSIWQSDTLLSPEQRKEIRKFLKNSEIGLTQDNMSKVLRSSLRGIFNPRVENTFFQRQILEHLERGHAEKLLKVSAKQEMYSILYTTDNAFRDTMDKMCADTRRLLEQKFSADVAGGYMTAVEYTLKSGSSEYLNCMDKYAASLDDQQYYQLLEAYQEYNKPLNKEIRRATKAVLQEGDPAFISLMLKLKRLSPYLSDKESGQAAKDAVRESFRQLCGHKDVCAAKDTWFEGYCDVIRANMASDVSGKYCERLGNTLNNVLRVMRPHYTVIQQARNLDKLHYQLVTGDKEVCKGLKQSIREHLNECLTNTDSFSAAFVRQRLERLRDNPSPEISGEILRYLYQTAPELQMELDNHIGNVYEKLKTKMSAVKAQAFVVRYRTDLMQGAEYNAIHNSIGWYAKLLDENLYTIILRENKNCYKEINGKVVKGLWNHLEDGEMLTLLQALREIPGENLAARQEAVKAIRQYIYRQDSPVDGETAFTEDMERCVTALREPFERFADANTALGFQERLRTDLWQSDLSCSNSFIITHFAEELEEHRCEVFLKQQLKSPEVRRFRTHLYQALQQVYQSEPLKKEQLLEVFRRVTDADGVAQIDREAMDDALRLLSTPKTDMIQRKAELMDGLEKSLAGSGLPPLTAERRKTLFENFFYGEEHNTFFFRETLQRAAAEGRPPPSNIFLVRRLLLDMGRALCGQTVNAQRYGHGPDAQHSFRAKKQFQNIRFPREEGLQQEQ